MPDSCDPIGIACLSGVGLNGSQFHCDICGNDVTKQPCRIRCAVCRDFDLCVRCFSKREEKDEHQWTHSYLVIGGRSMPLIHKDWSAIEEFILVEGVSRVGLGNWNDVADSITLGTSALQIPKRISECEKHYNEHYLDMKDSMPQLKDLYIPDNVIPEHSGLNTISLKRRTKLSSTGGVAVESPVGWRRIDSQRWEAHFQLPMSDRAEVRHPLKIEGCVENRAVLSEETTSGQTETDSLVHIKEELRDEPLSAPSLPIRLASATRHTKDPEVIPGSHIHGSLPLRNELENEYDPEAENMIADLEFRPDDTPLEIDAKLMSVAIYNSRLQERCRRKNALLNKASLDLRKHKQFSYCRTQEDREIALLTFPLGQYLSEEEHDEFIRLIMEERRVNVRLAYIREWLMNGLCSLDDVQKYEMEVYHLQCNKALGPERHYDNGLHMDMFTPEEQKLVKFWESRTDVKCADRLTSGSSSTGTTGPLLDSKYLVKGSLGTSTAVQDSPFNVYRPSVLDKPPRNVSQESQSLTNGGKEGDPFKGTASHMSDDHNAGNDIGQEGYSYLNFVERGLCSTLDITPLQFLLLRVIVSKEAVKWTDINEELPGFLRYFDIQESKLPHLLDSMIVLPCPSNAAAKTKSTPKESNGVEAVEGNSRTAMAHRKPRTTGSKPNRRMSRLPPAVPHVRLKLDQRGGVKNEPLKSNTSGSDSVK